MYCPGHLKRPTTTSKSSQKKANASHGQGRSYFHHLACILTQTSLGVGYGGGYGGYSGGHSRYKKKRYNPPPQYTVNSNHTEKQGLDSEDTQLNKLLELIEIFLPHPDSPNAQTFDWLPSPILSSRIQISSLPEVYHVTMILPLLSIGYPYTKVPYVYV